MTVTPNNLTAADFARLDKQLEAVLSDATTQLANQMNGVSKEEEELDDTIKKTYNVPVNLIVELTEKEVWDITDGESDLVSNLMCVPGIEESFVGTPEEVK